MSTRHFLFVIVAHGLPSKSAIGGDFTDRWVDLGTLRAAIAGQYSQRIEITPDQWRFLRGVYAMNAEAPPGLPCGKDVVLAQGGDNSDSLLFFVDGDKFGAPMHAPLALLSLIEQQRRPKKVLNSPNVIVRATVQSAVGSAGGRLAGARLSEPLVYPSSMSGR